jgi:glycosyltransferase involved in cell wall biosynthesis
MQVRIPSGLRWWRFALFFIKAVLIGLRVRPHIVHAHDYFLVFHGWVIAELTRAVCVYDAHEFLPGIRERSRVRHWLFTALERASIKHCDLVIATSEERAQAIEDHYGLREPPVVVGNIASSEDGPLDTSGEMTAYDLESVIQRGLPVVVYQGAMDIHCRCLDNLLRAFSDLREDCSLVMAGDGPDLDHLRKLTANLGLEHSVLFTGRLSRSQLVSVMRAASIGVVIYSNKEVNNILCTPNKLHEYARAGLAVVTSNQPPLAQMLGEHPIGELFDPDRPETIQQAIRTVLSSLDAYESRIPAFLAQHDWNNERARLLEAYARLRA